jgi:hypothetical protein
VPVPETRAGPAPGAIGVNGPGTVLPPPTRARRRAGWISRQTRWILAGLIFAGSFVLRYLDPGLTNDQFAWISGGRQIRMYGEHPFRDFREPGYFLQNYASAAAQLAFGDNLLGEVLLAVSLLSAGAALTFLLASEASRSTLVGALMAALVVAIYPRLYNYPKVFLLALGIFVCWRYADRPTTRNLLVVGLVTALAFLFRHDLGLFVGAASAVTVAAVHWRDGLRPLLRRSILYGVAVFAPLVPFFLFIQASGGILAYFGAGIAYSREEADRSKLGTRPGFVVDWTAPLVIIQPPAPPPPPESARPARIKVVWAPDVTPETRAELERRFSLRVVGPDEATPSNGRWSYDLVDTSGSNIRALVTDRRVEDTDNLDRKAYRVPGRERPFSLRVLLQDLQRFVPLPGVQVLPGLIRPANAVPWLYYLLFALPGLALAVLLVVRLRRPAHAALPNETAKILGVAVLCGLATPVPVRHPFLGRLPDIAAPSAVLAAWLLGALIRGRVRIPALPGASRAPERPSPPAARGAAAFGSSVARRAVAAVLILITAISIGATGEVGTHLEQSGLLDNPDEVFRRGVQVHRELRWSPAIALDTWAPPGSTGLQGLARYVYACTKPTDRILLVAKFAPEFYFYTKRGFAGGGIFPNEDKTIGKLGTQSVPIIIMNMDEYEPFADFFDRTFSDRWFDRYLSDRYRVALEAGTDGFGGYQVFVDSQAAPTGTYEPLSLPCYG